MYNNSFQSSIGMAPYEALYGGKCRTPLCWTELSEKKVIGPDLIQETKEKVKMIRERLKMAIDRPRSEVYFEILGKIARGLGNSTEFQYNVPPTNGWTI